MDLRNWMYDRGLLRSHSLGVRTISIGNLTTGGTGKTPLVALAADILAESGERVCVLTRGYRRANEKERVLVSNGESVLADAATGGDEPVELARKLIGKAVVIADADRVGAARWAKERFGITAFVLDDGFQHRRAKRDIDIVCVDAMKPLNGMLPVGTLREPPKGLRRANAVVITRADLVKSIEDLESRISDLRSQIANQAPEALIFSSENEIASISSLDEYGLGLNSARANDLDQPWARLAADVQPGEFDDKVRVFAFCGIGNPESFFLLLNKQFHNPEIGVFDLSLRKAFPDHHSYSQMEIDELCKWADEYGIDVFLTTAKDAGKLRDLKFEIPCYVVEIEPRIDRPQDFQRLITFSS